MKIQSVTSLIFLLIFSVVTIAFLPHSFLPKRIQRTTPSPFKTPNDDFLIPQISQSFLRRNQGQSSSTALFGIPKLFRWLVDLYPIVVESVGDVDQNSLQIDNFYLDMNGIIHSCTHSNEGELIALDEKQMFLKIFDYTDRLFQLVKPKRLMFLAIDGVAPRAKMNQQRSRRYRASKEREALIAQYVAKEGKLPETDSFDSNCITPGTDFMHRLSVAFRAWIEYKMKSDASWQTGVEVIFSGPDVPGEGEHKVMDQIRFEQEHDPDYRAKRYRHCMYGLDADLIMLGLVTHEPHFVLLREKILRGGTTATQRAKSTGKKSFAPEDFEILELSILRTMLTQYFSKRNDDMGKWIKQKLTSVEKNYAGIVDGPTNTGERGSAKEEEEVSTSSSKLSKKSPSDDIERLIDDFVFMCYFVGNDFLPCIPHLDIADGALNYMMNIYKQLFPTMGGYLTNKHQIHLPRLELFLQEIARREPLYFQQRSMDENEKQYATPEYKDHYYKLKFGFTADNSTAKRQVVQSYMEGLFWVLTYYHYGCASWTWYYPYLYGPLASDLTNLSSLSFQFEKGRPFTPLLQLLSVLPPQSGKLLPSSYSKYMVDESSPLSRFYPRDFEVDANGKKNSWECVVQIPFIEEEVLVNTISQIDHRSDLSKSERIRNLPGNTHQYKITPKEEVDKEEGMKEKGEKGGEKRKKKGVTNNNTASSSSAAAASSTTAPSTSSPHKFKNALIDDRKRHHQ